MSLKYMVEEAYTLDSIVEENINESTGKSEKNYYITGIFSTPNQKNRNGRTYPLHLWEREVSKYKEEIKKKSKSAFGEFEHPERVSVEPMKAVIRMVEVDIKNGLVIGKAKILNNNSEKTNQLKALIDEGLKIGVSSRGVGKVGQGGLVEDFKLTTWDVVGEPSDYNSHLDGIMESLTESMGSKEFEYNEENDSIVEICTKNKCSKEKKEDVQKAILESFKRIFEESEEKVKPEEKEEKEEKNGSLPYAIRQLTIKNLKYILSKITGSDKYIKVSDLIYLLNQNNTSSQFDSTVLTDLYHQVQSKKYLKGEEK